jgi:hypothetical protein
MVWPAPQLCDSAQDFHLLTISGYFPPLNAVTKSYERLSSAIAQQIRLLRYQPFMKLRVYLFS